MLPANPISDLSAWQVSRGRVRLTWRLNLAAWVKLKIYRSIDDAPRKFVTDVGQTEQYIDENVPTGSQNRTITYFLEIDGLDVPASSARLGVVREDPVAARIVRDEMRLLRHWGNPVAYFPIKSFGARCECYDTILERVMDDSCVKCRGTGRKNGYSDPFITYVLGESQKNRVTNITEFGEIETNERVYWTTDPHACRPRDLMVTADNQRLNIKRVAENSLRGTPTRQILQCAEINPSDIEYDFEVPDGVLEVLRTQPLRSKHTLA